MSYTNKYKYGGVRYVMIHDSIAKAHFFDGASEKFIRSYIIEETVWPANGGKPYRAKVIVKNDDCTIKAAAKALDSIGVKYRRIKVLSDIGRSLVHEKLSEVQYSALYFSREPKTEIWLLVED